jgi:hypothetical protein
MDKMRLEKQLADLSAFLEDFRMLIFLEKLLDD